MIAVGLIEDDAEFRDMVAGVLRGTERISVTVAERDATSGLAALRATPPQVALVDIRLPGASGIELVARLAPELPETALLMLTSVDTDESVFDALKAGAVGYLLKDSPPASLIAAVEDAQRGGSPMSWNIARRVVQSFSRRAEPAAATATLSARERDVLDQLARGLAYKGIADHLQLSADTVRTHIRHIYRKLHVNSRTEAVMKYLGR